MKNEIEETIAYHEAELEKHSTAYDEAAHARNFYQNDVQDYLKAEYFEIQRDEAAEKVYFTRKTIEGLQQLLNSKLN